MTDARLDGPTSEATRHRAATAREAKALAHPLRLRIIRLCTIDELTNKQLADRLEQDPGTVLYHVRQLLDTGFLEQCEVRTGPSGALEKPYRSTGRSWTLDVAKEGDEVAIAPLDALRSELIEAGSESLELLARFAFRLSPDDASDFATRLESLVEEFREREKKNPGEQVYGGLIALHRLAT